MRLRDMRAQLLLYCLQDLNMPSLGYRSGKTSNCLVCAKEFYAYPYVIKKGYGKFCSHDCYSKTLNKGDDVGYEGLHAWVRKERGTPEICEHCGTIEAKKYEWANKSGEYKRDLDDWIRLCTSCHHKYDDTLAKAWGTRRQYL